MVAWAHLLSDPSSEPRSSESRRGRSRSSAPGRSRPGSRCATSAARFSAPFVMPSGRRERVLLTLEHLLGADDVSADARARRVALDTFTRAEVAERICDALAFLHRHAIVASDIAPNNLLVAFGAGDEPEVCLIDCDSMVFHGRQALAVGADRRLGHSAAFGESPNTRAADAYKLGLVVLRLFARSHDARSAGAASCGTCRSELRGLLARALAADAVNRPPAGEWQRALRGLLADGRLNERYPGPAPTPRVVVRRAPPAAGSEVVGGTGDPRDVPARAAPPWTDPPGFALGRRGGSQPGGRRASRDPGTGALWLRRAVVVAWIVAGTAVLCSCCRGCSRPRSRCRRGQRRRRVAVRAGRQQPLHYQYRRPARPPLYPRLPGPVTARGQVP